MSAGAGRRASRRARRATVVAVLVVLALLGVLAGLAGRGGGPGAASGPSSSPSARATTRPSQPVSPPRSSPTAGRDAETGLRLVALASLPREAQATVALVDRGGPFPYAQDGVTFGNNERRLPSHPRGWYREYTVRTPGERDRGARRIVTGDDDRQVFYTADHYGSFVRVAR